MTLDPAHFEPELKRPSRWPLVLAGVVILFGIVVLLLWPVKVPYYAMSPGPVEEVSGLISIPDEPTYPLEGDLYLLTVGLREVNVFEWVEAHFSDETDLIGREQIRPSGTTQEEVTRRNLESMNESIDTAIYVALERLGYEVGFSGSGAVVVQVVEGSGSAGVLEVGDVITSVEGQAVQTSDEAAAIIRTHGVGDTITIGGTRGEEPLDVAITLTAHPDIEGAPMLGVALDIADLELQFPIAVNIDSRNIGGPSAGMMYALTVIDLLTEGDLTGGNRIAGTGTIRFDQTIGPIGGVRQKVFAARGIGANYVLVPTDNYADALTAAGGEITVVSIATLQDALDFLGTLEPLPAVLATG
ncbi:MAG: PDZ domain-containing protein [Actinobacteria bacterium]|nr:PDZ domain-containing protein [Actinomycetota bacterium]MBU1494126.1 PDZ domain-containing protein [Actinomycetota bacterium]MBU1866393.1 PDZ domain-containing protein [Actinomycetota bacterium]